MTTTERILKVGDLITNGSSAGSILELVNRDPRWKTSGVKISNISLERFNGNVGMSSFVPDYLLNSWRVIVAGEWTPVLGAPGVEESYGWSSDYGHLQRALRRQP